MKRSLLLLILFSVIIESHAYIAGSIYFQRGDTQAVFVDNSGAHHPYLCDSLNPHIDIPVYYWYQNYNAIGATVHKFVDSAQQADVTLPNTSTGFRQFSFTGYSGTLILRSTHKDSTSATGPEYNFYECVNTSIDSILPPDPNTQVMNDYNVSFDAVFTGYTSSIPYRAYFGSIETEILFSGEAVSGIDVLKENTSSFEQTAAVLPSSFIVDIDEGAGWQSFSVSFQRTGSTASGGDTFYASISLDRFFSPGEDTSTTNTPDPEIDPLPIDPTNPPEPIDPVVQTPEGSGGDTVTTVASNYSSFEQAMEAALDARNLSQIELQEAHENALNNQGLSNEMIQNSFENALYNMGQYPEKQRDALQNALNRQGLSGLNIGKNVSNGFDSVLKKYGLSAEKIGSAVSGLLSNSNVAVESELAGIGEAVTNIYGAVDDVEVLLGSINSNLVAQSATNSLTMDQEADRWEAELNQRYQDVQDSVDNSFNPIKTLIEGLKSNFNTVSWGKSYDLGFTSIPCSLVPYQSIIETFRSFVLIFIQYRACIMAIKMLQNIVRGAVL